MDCIGDNGISLMHYNACNDFGERDDASGLYYLKKN